MKRAGINNSSVFSVAASFLNVYSVVTLEIEGVLLSIRTVPYFRSLASRATHSISWIRESAFGRNTGLYLLRTLDLLPPRIVALVLKLSMGLSAINKKKPNRMNATRAFLYLYFAEELHMRLWPRL